jgi:hypothetical protein
MAPQDALMRKRQSRRRVCRPAFWRFVGSTVTVTNHSVTAIRHAAFPPTMPPTRSTRDRRRFARVLAKREAREANARGWGAGDCSAHGRLEGVVRGACVLLERRGVRPGAGDVLLLRGAHVLLELVQGASAASQIPQALRSTPSRSEPTRHMNGLVGARYQRRVEPDGCWFNRRPTWETDTRPRTIQTTPGGSARCRRARRAPRRVRRASGCWPRRSRFVLSLRLPLGPRTPCCEKLQQRAA